MNKKTGFILPLLLLFVFPSVFAETIVLKSGKTIDGKILEKTDKNIKVDISGIPVTYYLEEIESIDGQAISMASNNSINQVSKEIAQNKAISTESNTSKASNESYSASNKQNIKKWEEWYGEAKDYLNKSGQLVIRTGKIISGTQDTIANRPKNLTVSEQIEYIQKQLKEANSNLDLFLNELDMLQPPQELMDYHLEIKKAIQDAKSWATASLEMNNDNMELKLNEAKKCQIEMVKSLQGSFVKLKIVYNQHNAPKEQIEYIDTAIGWYDKMLIEYNK